MTLMLLRLDPDDNVAIARTTLPPGTECLPGVRARTELPRGHKVALADIRAGAPVRKLGHVIGIATRPIAAGEHVHDHNLRTPSQAETAASVAARGIRVDANRLAAVDRARSFLGFRRSDGRVATRNYIGVLTTVNCSATVARGIADAFRAPEAFAAYPNIDGVVAFTHPTGCGMQAGGAGHEILERVTRGYIDHPNFAAVLVIGLGCEVNHSTAYAGAQSNAPERVQIYDIQDAGGTRQAIGEGVARVRALLGPANEVRREPMPISALVAGLQCGGSDAFSALTANPALGVAVDLLVAHGGTALLSETPECAPWMELLCARAAEPALAGRLRELVDWWEAHARANGATLDGNPSPGNKAGGLSTIAEKALGAIAKGGTSPIVDVRAYAESSVRRGLVYMDSPGFDPVSATGQIAAGANLVCFTTGRGSVFGAKPAPSLKLATNTEVFERMREDMDLDCGRIFDGKADLARVGREIFERMIAVASGERTASELLDIGANEFAPWQLGATL